MTHKLFVGLALLAFVAGAAAIPSQAMQNMPDQAMQGFDESSEKANSPDMVEPDVESAEPETPDPEEQVSRGPPGFVQDKLPGHVLDRVPDFFWS